MTDDGNAIEIAKEVEIVFHASERRFGKTMFQPSTDRDPNKYSTRVRRLVASKAVWITATDRSIQR